MNHDLPSNNSTELTNREETQEEKAKICRNGDPKGRQTKGRLGIHWS